MTGCLRPTATDNLFVLAGIQPIELRRQNAILSLARRTQQPEHLLHERLASPSFGHFVATQIETSICTCSTETAKQPRSVGRQCSTMGALQMEHGMARKHFLAKLTLKTLSYTNQQPPQRDGAVPDPVWVGRNGCWPSRGSELPRALPFIFSLCCPLNDRRRAALSFFKIGCLFSLFLFSCSTLALLCLLVFLLLLMSGNVQPWPHFSLLCVRWKCDLAGQVSAVLHLLQISPFKVLTTFPLQIQSSRQLSLLELPLLL